ncbi:MAG: putative formyl transferase [Mycobacterium sp.]|nr:putative formyl transferase [Mycobacterium sp.]
MLGQCGGTAAVSWFRRSRNADCHPRAEGAVAVRILLLCSAFNGLTQRVWEELRWREHDVVVELYGDPDDVVAAADAVAPNLVLCPYLKERVPERVWRNWRTVIIHPGPVGDQGPSSLDRAILDREPVWGVTALQAVEELDAGPIWAHRVFPMPAHAPRKSALYRGPVTAAAVACALEVVEHAGDPAFRPTPLDQCARPVPGTRKRPLLKQADRQFDWQLGAADIVRRIRAADGFPGIRTVLRGHEVSVFDAQPGAGVGPPGDIIGRHRGHQLVAAGQGAVWIGQLRRISGIKLPATAVLPVDDVPDVPTGPRDVHYRRHDEVGEVTFGFYNGAAGVDQCRRLEAALRYAAKQDTRVLVLQSGPDVFCNGIHLGEIEAAVDPAGAAWDNIQAINGVCRALIEVQDQLTVASYSGSAGAGGVMLALGADVVAGRSGVMLNPYYDMGLRGSELHTLTMPQRVGSEVAATLLAAKLPISTDRAAHIGLVDLVGPHDPVEYGSWLQRVARRYTEPASWRVIDFRAPAQQPLRHYESYELAEMAHDLYCDRSGFASARTDFVHKNQGRRRSRQELSVGDRSARDAYDATVARARTLTGSPALPENGRGLGIVDGDEPVSVGLPA